MNKTIIIIILILIIGAGAYFIIKNNHQSPAPNTNQNLPVTGISENKVAIKNFAFDPPVLNIKAGESVIWTNEDSVSHKISSDAFNSSNLNKGDSFQFKFDSKGTYDYICSIHPSMKGKIIVE